MKYKEKKICAINTIKKQNFPKAELFDTLDIANNNFIKIKIISNEELNSSYG
jgi:hypothetical protein